MIEYMTVRLSLEGDAPEKPARRFGPMRCIQTDDTVLKAELLRELGRLLDRYEKKGCYVGR